MCGVASEAIWASNGRDERIMNGYGAASKRWNAGLVRNERLCGELQYGQRRQQRWLMLRQLRVRGVYATIQRGVRRSGYVNGGARMSTTTVKWRTAGGYVGGCYVGERRANGNGAAMLRYVCDSSNGDECVLDELRRTNGYGVMATTDGYERERGWRARHNGAVAVNDTAKRRTATAWNMSSAAPGPTTATAATKYKYDSGRLCETGYGGDGDDDCASKYDGDSRSTTTAGNGADNGRATTATAHGRVRGARRAGNTGQQMDGKTARLGRHGKSRSKRQISK